MSYKLMPYDLTSLRPSTLIFFVTSIALVISICLLWSVHSQPRINSASADAHEWRQPQSLSERFPKPVSTNVWQFDFAAVETSLHKIKHSQGGELTLNASAASILEDAVAVLPTDMDEAALQRLELLVEKGFPANTSQQLASVLTKFYHFQQAVNQARLSASVTDQEQVFKKNLFFQKRYLGEALAQQLFGRQNSVNRYLYARKRINEDSSLNQAQKLQQLSILQARFKDNAK